MTSAETPEAWEPTTLGDLASDVRYGYTATASSECIGPRFLRITDIVRAPIRWDEVPYCDTPGDTRGKYHLRRGDIVIARTGASAGSSAYCDPPEDAVFASYLVRFRFAPRVDPLFLGYVLASPRWRAYVEAEATGSAQPQFNAPVMKGFPLALPPRAEQERIAWVLGSFDDKIESNRRCVRLLDRLYEGLFRVHCLPSLESLPEGWRCGSAENLARYVNGPAATKHANGKGRLIIRIKELNAGIGPASVYSDVEMPPDNIADDDAILFAWSGSLGIYRWHHDDAIINQHIFKVVCDRGYPAWFVLGHLLALMPGFRAVASDKATTMGHIKRAHLSEAAVPLPPADAIDRWGREIRPIYDQVHARLKEARTLAATRDALLHKLISGEIRVPDTMDPAEVGGAFEEAAV